MYVHTYVRMYAHVRMYVHVGMYIHVSMYIHVLIYAEVGLPVHSRCVEHTVHKSIITHKNCSNSTRRPQIAALERVWKCSIKAQPQQVARINASHGD